MNEEKISKFVNVSLTVRVQDTFVENKATVISSPIRSYIKNEENFTIQLTQ